VSASTPAEGPVAVVVGGASGIGAACARELARRGGQVVVTDIDADRARDVAAEFGGRWSMLDVTDEEQVLACAARIEDEVGPVAVLVNSAAVFQAPARPERLSAARWESVVRVCQRGVYATCTAFAPAMVSRRAGSIVNIGSVAGVRSLPLHAYGPAKAAVISLSASLAAEWGPSQVRVNCVSPGFSRTEAVQRAIDEGLADGEQRIAGTALGRLVEPAEVAKAVAFLASDDASAITGINLVVDCGWLAGDSWAAYGGLRAPAAG
jgi:NAD(P)-dependent dehydrogenase (short-subunit alcohol dehydrogenase family)